MTMNAETSVSRGTYAGLFMVSLATLMYETLLTRIFSVTMWYHFAFVAVSVALFGMTLGAVLVYLFPRYFTPERARGHLALSALWFAITVVLSFLTHLSIPFIADQTLEFKLSIVELYSMAFTYVVLAVPFIFSGICVCLALTKFPRRVSRLYAADLAGAALGCILVIYVLKITDGPTAVVAVAALASIGSLVFASGAGSRKLGIAALLFSLLFVSFTVVNTVRVNAQAPSFIRLMWVKGALEPPPLYEKWNSFSRIRVDGNPNEPERPFGWGLSPIYPADRRVRQLFMSIDSTAGTFLTYFDGNLNALDFLAYDVTNLAHYLRRDARVLVIGSGGGRDILAALVFDQRSVVGVEINEEIIHAVNGEFGDFTGHLDKNPRVTFVNDEARSYVARSSDHFDVIQGSLTDTWAATAAGAFVLSENSLYTVEAWDIFLDHLTQDGVLTFSRWYFEDRPAEMYRLTSLASAALLRRGIENPREHIILVRAMTWGPPGGPEGIGTILVSPSPFSERDLNAIETVASQLQFEVVLSPRFALDTTFAALASGRDLDAFTANYPLNISPPTDDNPFFFFMLRFRDVLNRDLWEQGGMSINMKAVFILGSLLIVVVLLTLLGIIVPLVLTTDKPSLRGAWPLSLYFACIGLGFMLVEISQMQRLIVFLGHPTYGLSVVLFALLLSSGLGSFLTEKIGNPGLGGSAIVRLLLLLGALVLFGVATPFAISAFQGSFTWLRILVAVGILIPLGLLMGMAFPIGMKIATARTASITPWLWGINGATSVCASVLAVVISLGSSISSSFWAGFGCYVVAVGAFLWMTWRARKGKQ